MREISVCRWDLCKKKKSRSGVNKEKPLITPEQYHAPRPSPPWQLVRLGKIPERAVETSRDGASGRSLGAIGGDILSPGVTFARPVTNLRTQRASNPIAGIVKPFPVLEEERPSSWKLSTLPLNFK